MKLFIWKAIEWGHRAENSFLANKIIDIWRFTGCNKPYHAEVGQAYIPSNNSTRLAKFSRCSKLRAKSLIVSLKTWWIGLSPAPLPARRLPGRLPARRAYSLERGYSLRLGEKIWHAEPVRRRWIIRACFSQERMTYIAADQSADGLAKVIYDSNVCLIIKKTWKFKGWVRPKLAKNKV